MTEVYVKVENAAGEQQEYHYVATSLESKPLDPIDVFAMAVGLVPENGRLVRVDIDQMPWFQARTPVACSNSDTDSDDNGPA